MSIPVSQYDFAKRKVLPTFGVSFGLPYPSGAYPFNALGGGFPAPNQHFGSIGPNGLSLGLLNVNPLLSLQVTKSEYGEKLVKPLVNLHVTPNEHLIHKVGQLFQAKKEVFLNQHEHYHHHSHHAYPPPPPIYHPEHHHPHPPHHHYSHGHYPSGPEVYSETVPTFEAGSYGFPEPHYKDSTGFESGGPPFTSIADGSNHLYPEYSGSEYFKRSFNESSRFAFPSSGYADQYNYDFHGRQQKGFDFNENPQSLTRPIPTPAPGHAAGGRNIAFPNSRRKRSPEMDESGKDVLISKVALKILAKSLTIL